MSETVKPLAYFDSGALSAIRELLIEEYQYRIVYSNAHLADLANSDTPELELQFLKDHDAYFITQSQNTVSAHKRDPFEAFHNRSDLNESYMAPLISFFSGGGPDQSDQEAAKSFFEQLVQDEPLLEHLVDPTIASTGLTNRNIEQGIDKSTSKVDLSKGLRSLFATFPQEARSALTSTFPDTNPSFQDIVIGVTTLGMMGLVASTGIRKRNAAKSQKVARHDWIDAHHIAFGFHCHLFASNDKPALKRARVLKDYWSIGTELFEIARH